MTGHVFDMTAIINRTPCPFGECMARQGQSCWSTYLGRPMVNQVHSERRTAANATARNVA